MLYVCRGRATDICQAIDLLKENDFLPEVVIRHCHVFEKDNLVVIILMIIHRRKLRFLTLTKYK